MRLGILLIMNRAFPVSASLVRPRGFSAPWRVLLVCILGFALSAMTVKAVAINITVDNTGALLNGTGVANMSAVELKCTSQGRIKMHHLGQRFF